MAAPRHRGKGGGKRWTVEASGAPRPSSPKRGESRSGRPARRSGPGTGGKDDGRLSGKTCLVTAAGQGIGRASALAMAAEGARVVATDIDEAALATLEGVENPPASTCSTPPTSPPQETAIGAPDVLFNCAGFVANGTILDCDEDEWDFSFDLNVKAMYRMIRAFLAGDGRGGRRLDRQHVLGRLVDHRGPPTRFVYGATKGGAVIGPDEIRRGRFRRPGHPLQRDLSGDGRFRPSLEGRLRATGDYEGRARRLHRASADGADRQRRGNRGTRRLPRLRRGVFHNRSRPCHRRRLVEHLKGRTMKLIRHGERGQERPGMVAPDGSLRDLTGVVEDIGGEVLSDEGLDRLRGIDARRAFPRSPPARASAPASSGTGKVICIGLNYSDHAAEAGMEVPPRADHLHEGDECDLRPGRPDHRAARLGEDRLGGGTRGRDRHPARNTSRKPMRLVPCRRLRR